MSNRIDNKTVAGLQDLHYQACEALVGCKDRGIEWARAMIATVNSGNGLLRTNLRAQPGQKPAPSAKAPRKRG